MNLTDNNIVRKYLKKGHRMMDWCPNCSPNEPSANSEFSPTWDDDGRPIWAHDEFNAAPVWKGCTYTLPRMVKSTKISRALALLASCDG
jgi:hypothetical protein